MEKKKINKTGDNQVIASFYEPPSIEVVEVSIERGFASSSEDWVPGEWN